jgi:hypothetical protein
MYNLDRRSIVVHMYTIPLQTMVCNQSKSAGKQEHTAGTFNALP